PARSGPVLVRGLGEHGCLRHAGQVGGPGTTVGRAEHVDVAAVAHEGDHLELVGAAGVVPDGTSGGRPVLAVVVGVGDGGVVGVPRPGDSPVTHRHVR